MAFDLLMFFAIGAGTVLAQPPTVRRAPLAIHRHVARPAVPKKRTTIEFSFGKGIVPLPAARPHIASVPKVEILLPTDPDRYPFVWQGKYALPPNYVQIWKYIG